MASLPAAPPTTGREQKPSGFQRNWKGKRRHNDATNGGQFKKPKRKKAKPAKEGSAEEVLMMDIQSMLAAQKLSGPAADEDEEGVKSKEAATPALPEPGSEIEVEVVELSSTGDGLALQKGSKRIYTVPFAVVGDTVRVKVYRHLEHEQYSVADFIAVTKPSPLRDDARIRCRYFSKCSGCQFQMLDYGEQLALKKRIVEKAFRNFSQLPPELIPGVLDTIGSPLQYGYRTKLTPHFDGPPGYQKKGLAQKPTFDAVPDIGFMQKGSRKVLDIEDCPIGTDAVRQGMRRERERLQTEYAGYTRGATILLRESTRRYPKDGAPPPPAEPTSADAVRVEADTYTDIKTCITDNNATSTEYVGDYTFTNPAGAFFQNNNSILPVFTAYVREHVLPPAGSVATAADDDASNPRRQIKYLIDAYSGSGLFTITLSSVLPGGSVGIDIADKSIASARANAALNNLPPERCRFIAADAPQLFRDVNYHPDETVVVLDPPRKGCDASFLRQLLAFGPRRVVYVSCNVHTQARDVGILVRGEVDGSEGVDEEEKEEEEGGGGDSRGDGSGPGESSKEEKSKKMKKTRYEIESLRGFDFFPQTGHVEGVAVLNRVDG